MAVSARDFKLLEVFAELLEGLWHALSSLLGGLEDWLESLWDLLDGPKSPKRPQ